MKVLFHSVNGTGLGHLMRSSAIATALASISDRCQIALLTSGHYTEHLRRLSFLSLTVPDIHGPDLSRGTLPWDTVRDDVQAEALSMYAPDVVVFDTYAPPKLVAEARQRGAALVLVWRLCRPEHFRERLRRGLFHEFDRVVVPHTREDVWSYLPRELAAEFEAFAPEYVGLIAYPASIDHAAEKAALRKLGLTEQDRIVLLTAGGGWYASRNRAVWQTVSDTAAILRRRTRSAILIWVGGPYGDASLPAAVFDRVIGSTLDVQCLMRSSALVISHAGYNSVAEVTRTGARAVFVVSDRKSEDQGAHVRSLVARGRAVVWQEGADPEKEASRWEEVMLNRRRPVVVLHGAELAAKVILGVAGSVAQ